MASLSIGDKVRVEVTPGYSKRGVYGISVLYSTSPEAKFEGAVGRITEINPTGTHHIPLYLVDFKEFDNSRVGIPWQAQWFRQEWLEIVEPAAVAV